MQKHKYTGRALLPGNLKNRIATELPALLALKTLGTEWLTEAQLAEFQSVGLTWHLVSGEQSGADVVLCAAAVLARGTKPSGCYEATHDEIELLRALVPGVVESLNRAPNYQIAAAIQRASSLMG